jgi:hypothetical protein
MKNTKGINLSRQSAKPFIHDFLLQQNYATYKQLISFKFENGCKNDRFNNLWKTIGIDENYLSSTKQARAIPTNLKNEVGKIIAVYFVMPFLQPACFSLRGESMMPDTGVQIGMKEGEVLSSTARLKLNGFWHCMYSHRICFGLAAISCRRSTIGSYVLRRSKFGRASYVHEGWCPAWQIRPIFFAAG